MGRAYIRTGSPRDLRCEPPKARLGRSIPAEGHRSRRRAWERRQNRASPPRRCGPARPDGGARQLVFPAPPRRSSRGPVVRSTPCTVPFHRTTVPGTLYVVATPIGNLEDITLRALRVLREADAIACEDTRQTRKLLQHFDIAKPTLSYHEHNAVSRTEELIARLARGENIALVSDAGTPLLSDPGYRVVRAAIDGGIPVVPIPGPSAALAALAAAGLATDEFRFCGFLPQKSGQRRRFLEELRDETCTIVCYEAPHRILAALEDIEAAMGARPVVVARE